MLALAMSQAQAANQYQYRVAARGVAAAQAIDAPKSVGDGISVAGACASGAKAGCIAWNPVGVSAALTVSGAPALTVSLNDCHRQSGCSVNGTKSYSTGKWYGEYTLSRVTTGYGGYLFGLTAPTVSIDSASSIYYYTYTAKFA